MCVCVLSPVRLFATLWIVACQAPLSMEFSRQEHWSGLPCPSLGNLPKPGMEPASPALSGRFFTTSPPEDIYIRGKNCIDQNHPTETIDVYFEKYKMKL